MKKIVFSLLLTAYSGFSFGQTVSFEELNLPQAESFYNGSDGAGGFSFLNIQFSNNYTQAGDYWNGFIYSNLTDTITPGYANQYSGFAGSGANGSEKYAICYPAGKITFPQIGVPLNVMVTNTTYAGISMRDGDAYAKKFGSPNNALGTPDGTNGEDFFKLTIHGLNFQDDIISSLDIYLADFRFTEDSLDYILNYWKSVDLTSLGNVYGLSFELQSSDIGDFGMNTPGYFALDNLVFAPLEGLEESTQTAFQVAPNPMSDWLTIQGGEGELTVFDIAGAKMIQQVHSNFSKVDVSTLSAGTYIVQLQSNGRNYMQKVIK
jgi:hypothetical protein